MLCFHKNNILFPLPCGAGSAVPREGFVSNLIMPFSWFVVAVTLPIYSVGPHAVSSLHIYTFVVSQAFIAGAATKQETLTPPRHLVLPLVCRGPWMSPWCSIVVLQWQCISSFVFYCLNFCRVRQIIEVNVFFDWRICESEVFAAL